MKRILENKKSKEIKEELIQKELKRKGRRTYKNGIEWKSE